MPPKKQTNAKTVERERSLLEKALTPGDGKNLDKDDVLDLIFWIR